MTKLIPGTSEGLLALLAVDTPWRTLLALGEDAVNFAVACILAAWKTCTQVWEAERTTLSPCFAVAARRICLAEWQTARISRTICTAVAAADISGAEVSLAEARIFPTILLAGTAGTKPRGDAANGTPAALLPTHTVP